MTHVTVTTTSRFRTTLEGTRLVIHEVTELLFVGEEEGGERREMKGARGEGGRGREMKLKVKD